VKVIICILSIWLKHAIVICAVNKDSDFRNAFPDLFITNQENIFLIFLYATIHDCFIVRMGSITPAKLSQFYKEKEKENSSSNDSL
jgi:hypothetical protein